MGYTVYKPVYTSLYFEYGRNLFIEYLLLIMYQVSQI